MVAVGNDFHAGSVASASSARDDLAGCVTATECATSGAVLICLIAIRFYSRWAHRRPTHGPNTGSQRPLQRDWCTMPMGIR